MGVWRAFVVLLAQCRDKEVPDGLEQAGGAGVGAAWAEAQLKLLPEQSGPKFVGHVGRLCRATVKGGAERTAA